MEWKGSHPSVSEQRLEEHPAFEIFDSRSDLGCAHMRHLRFLDVVCYNSAVAAVLTQATRQTQIEKVLGCSYYFVKLKQFATHIGLMSPEVER